MQKIAEPNLYERFIQQLIGLTQQSEQSGFSLTALIQDYLRVKDRDKFAQIDKLKGWLDGFRPLNQTIVSKP